MKFEKNSKPIEMTYSSAVKIKSSQFSTERSQKEELVDILVIKQYKYILYIASKFVYNFELTEKAQLEKLLDDSGSRYERIGLNLLYINFRSILEPLRPPKRGNIWRLWRRVVILMGAESLFKGSGHRWGVNKSNGGQVTTGFLQSACCFRKYSVTIDSNEMEVTVCGWLESSFNILIIGDVGCVVDWSFLTFKAFEAVRGLLIFGRCKRIGTLELRGVWRLAVDEEVTLNVTFGVELVFVVGVTFSELLGRGTVDMARGYWSHCKSIKCQ